MTQNHVIARSGGFESLSRHIVFTAVSAIPPARRCGRPMASFCRLVPLIVLRLFLLSVRYLPRLQATALFECPLACLLSRIDLCRAFFLPLLPRARCPQGFPAGRRRTGLHSKRRCSLPWYP